MQQPLWDYLLWPGRTDKTFCFFFLFRKIHLIWTGSVFTLVRYASTALVDSCNENMEVLQNKYLHLSCSPRLPMSTWHLILAASTQRQWQSEVLTLYIPMEDDNHGRFPWPLSCRLPSGSPTLILLSQHLLKLLSSLILSKHCPGGAGRRGHRCSAAN